MDISKLEVIVSDKDPEWSLSSTENRYYHGCRVTQRREPYVVCQHVISAAKEGRLKKEDYTDCQRAITHSNCQAVYMRKAELEADKALYFQQRGTIAPSQQKRKSKPDVADDVIMVDKETFTSQPPVRKVPTPDGPVMMDHAEMVNKAMEKSI